MTKTLAAALIAAVALTVPATAKNQKSAPARDYAAGQPGNPREPAVVIAITMQETYDGKMLFAPDRVNVPVGQQVQFVLTNYGEIDHSFVIGTDGEAKERAISTKPAEPNARLVPAATQTELLWRFSKPGRYEFSSVLPGQYAAGMRGIVSVGEPEPEE